MPNIFSFVFGIGKGLLDLGNKLYQAFTMQVNISWLSKVINTLGGDINLPETISLSYILLTASASLLIGLIIYNLVK